MSGSGARARLDLLWKLLDEPVKRLREQKGARSSELNRQALAPFASTGGTVKKVAPSARSSRTLSHARQRVEELRGTPRQIWRRSIVGR